MRSTLAVCLVAVLTFAVSASVGSRNDVSPAPSPVHAALWAADDDSGHLLAARRGPECPTGSGAYCGAEHSHCCKINGAWTCVSALSDCKDD